MTDEQVEALIRRALQREDLWKHVDQAQSQFLNVGHPYTHLVLLDASVYERVREVVRIAKLGDAKDLEYVVRSTWEITAVEYQGPYYDAEGNLYTASAISVALKSGSRIQRIRVAVTYMASGALQEWTGAAENDYERHRRDMENAARQFVEMLLSGKGRDDSWDPLWQQGDLKIDADGISWIRSQIARG